MSVNQTLVEAAVLLCEDQIGELIVFEGDRPIGILAEEDLFRAIADRVRLEHTLVREYMTSSLLS